MKIQVSGAIASKNGVTLFSPTGDSTVYGQESWRTSDLLKAVLIPLSESDGTPIEVEIETFSLAKRIEQVTGGKVKVEEKIEDGVSTMALTTAAGVKVENAAPLVAQIERAAYEGSPGLGAFLERYAKVEHMQTAAEVLKFMEKLDLPLADDGCMILYKFLDRHPSKPGYYVDHHTRKVEQRVGSRVYMELKDYTKSRSECATGLHVCSKHYGQYGGEILLVKVRPEDVVAIPDHYSGKMRVLAYHVLARLDDEAHKAVGLNKHSALTAKGAKGIIAEIIAGQHIGVVEEVLVGAQGAFSVKVLEKAEVTAPRNAVREIKEKPAAIDPKGIKKALKEHKVAKEAPAPEPTGTEAWQLAKVGDFVRVEGSAKIPDGEYEVDRVSNDGRASRVRVKCAEYGSLGINNTLVKSIRARAADVEAPSPAPQQPSASAQSRIVENAARIKEGRKAEAPVQTITPEYRAKLDKAQDMLKAGSTLRQVDKALGMCRKSLARHIALGNIVV